MGAVKVQTLQLSIERGAAHAERLGCSRNVAIGARKRPLQHPAFRGGKAFDHFLRCAEQIGCGQRLPQACLGNSECQASRTRCPNDKIVRIDGNQGPSPLVGDRDDQDARSRVRQTKIFRLDPRCSIVHGHRDEIDETFGQVRPAR